MLVFHYRGKRQKPCRTAQAGFGFTYVIYHLAHLTQFKQFAASANGLLAACRLAFTKQLMFSTTGSVSYWKTDTLEKATENYEDK